MRFIAITLLSPMYILGIDTPFILLKLALSTSVSLDKQLLIILLCEIISWLLR